MVAGLATEHCRRNEMLENDYRGVVADWKVELLVRRAKKMGFRRHDLEDVQQEVILDVMKFEYDPSRSNGASEETALTAVIDKRLKMMVRGRKREQQRMEVIAPRQATEYPPPDGLALDVNDVTSRLSPDDQAVCRAMSEGECPRQIAVRLGWSWRRVEQAIARIRQHFTAAGLDGEEG